MRPFAPSMRSSPELIFLDVVMPGCTGIEVLSRITHRPSVVFTTAYDRFAVAAFEARALDYLLKPFGRRRLVATLERIRESVGADAASDVGSVERGRAALEISAPLDWLFVRERGPRHSGERAARGALRRMRSTT